MLNERTRIWLAFILILISFILVIIGGATESSRPGTMIYFICIFLLLWGFSMFLVNTVCVHRLEEREIISEYYFSIFLIGVMIFGTIISLLIQLLKTDLSLEDWLINIFLWLFIILLTYPLFHHYRKNKGIKN